MSNKAKQFASENDAKGASHPMKRLFRIFELSKNEQRVVLIVILVLITIAFIGYERRVHNPSVYMRSTTEPTASPTPVEAMVHQ
jgi:hypothetical protein